LLVLALGCLPAARGAHCLLFVLLLVLLVMRCCAGRREGSVAIVQVPGSRHAPRCAAARGSSCR
jgi:hypothetical protein